FRRSRLSSAAVGAQAERRKRNALRGIVAGAVLFCVGPAIGVIGNIAGMRQSYDTIETGRAPTPADLAHGVHLSLISLAAGVLLALVGALIVALSLVAYFRSDAEATRDPRAV